MTVTTTTTAPSTPAVDVLAFLGLDPRDVKAQALVAICNRYGLDPLLGHVVLVDRKPYITRDGLLAVAHASGVLDGVELVGDPVLSDDGTEWVARVRVYRRDWTHPVEYPGRYPARGRNSYGPEMAIKCAESMALRRAFPVSGLAVLDEIHDPAPVVERVDEADRPVDRPADVGPPAFAAAREALGYPARTDERPPTDRQLVAVNSRWRAAGCRDVTHRGWSVAALLGLPGYVASLRALTRADVSRLLDVDDESLAGALAATHALPDPGDVDGVIGAPAPGDPPDDHRIDDDVVDAEIVTDAAAGDPDVPADSLLVDEPADVAAAPEWPPVPDHLRTPGAGS